MLEMDPQDADIAADPSGLIGRMMHEFDVRRDRYRWLDSLMKRPRQ